MRSASPLVCASGRPPTPWRAQRITFEETIARSRESGDSEAEAKAQIGLAEVRQRQSDNRRALDSYHRALSLYRDRAIAPGVATALNGLGATYGRLSDYQQSIDAFNQALPLFRAQGNRAGEAAALNGIGAAQVRLNQYQNARETLEQSLPLYQALGDRAGEAAALQNIGYASFSQDDYDAAIGFYSRARALARAAAERGLEASIIYNTGQVYYHLGDYQTALNFYNDALPVHRELLNRSGEAAALSALGRVYRFLGDYQKALDHHAQALVILRGIGERMNEATTLNNTAHVYLSMGEYAKARPFFEESLAICRQVGNQSGIASNTNGIGLSLAGQNEPEKALEFHRQALQLFRAIGHRRAEADSLGHIGRAYQALHRYDQALTSLNEALAAYRAVSVPRQESETLYAIARTHRAAGDLSAASAAVDTAIGLAEGFRRELSSPPLRTTYLASVRDLYELKIDVLMQRQKRDAGVSSDARAFEVSERARARGLLDLLAEARTDIRAGVDPSLLERERVLAQRLAARAEKQTQLMSTKSSVEERATLAREIEADVAESQEVQAKIRAGSPRYAALMESEPLALRQVQADVLESDTLLLEYFLGVERSYLWAVTERSIVTYELPGRATIEAAAARFYDVAKTNRGGAELHDAARALSDLILAPAVRQMDRKRLAIVADGALHYVPFAALPEPPSAGPSSMAQPLIVQHEVVNLPSVSTLALLRREATGRVAAPRLLAVVADPVFDANDVRVRRSAGSASTATDAGHARLVRSVGEVGGPVSWPLPRLLGTRREARTIASLAPSGTSLQALDFDATRDVATGGELGSYQVVHFATHALINNQHPELSGLVLSLVDRQGRPRDGFLGLNDIYNLRLPAELVVLSACQTGLGQEIRGEGLIGLTRGFMYAGTPRLITSLWPVDDKATSELMRRFYSGLLGSQHLSAAAALRQAQIEMWREKDWQSVYYWAAFALHGEWQQAAAAAPTR